ncbi:APC family permease [Chryseobacterium sp. WG14]|uniref:APC family permease n=1 Tax=Chryseobacterium sp. WG14 TaxID=2926909 RepID=UPI00211E6A3A|nr:APC family permease [Chryseobacterium sp. WG14]MCQ9639788.1 APC family permease [Chryseobacterium sp. WG14]
MELRIKPFPKNKFPKKGLLIKGSSPVIWLQEMEDLDISLSQVESYAIPSDTPNILYGCFLIFNDQIPHEIGRNAYFQSVNDRFFIPEHTVFYPKINPEDWEHLDSRFIIMHPEFGLVKLSEEINWIALIQEPGKIEEIIRRPANGVHIAQNIESYTVEMDDEKILEALQPKQTEEEWTKNLPFDLKKVMAGNKKEIEKYLKYIEKYPERAIELGVPLDIMGTSRGNGFEKFSWFEGLFGNTGGKPETKRARNSRRIFWAMLVIAVILRFALPSDKDKKEQEETGTSSGSIVTDAVKDPSDMVAFQSGISEIDQKIDSIYQDRRAVLSKEVHVASTMISAKEKEREQYRKSGGRNLNEISPDIDKLVAKEKQSRDSLKIIYSRKIKKHIEARTEKLKRKLSDSLKQYSRGKPVNGDVVKYLVRKKQVLMADSLGRLYGTIDLVDASSAPVGKSKIKGVEPGGSKPEEKAAVSDILYLIIFMIGAVGIYLFIFKKKALHLGGDNVPGWIKFLLIAILVMMLIYLFYPLVKMFGYNWFVWALIICVILLLYRLFREDKTILNTEDDE